MRLSCASTYVVVTSRSWENGHLSMITFRTRLENLFVHQTGRTPPNLYHTDTDEDFEKSLRILLRQFLCPLLSPLTNISGLKKLYRNNVFSKSLVSREAREIISNLS